MAWLYRIKVKHLFTEKEDHASVQESMSAIADTLESQPCFWDFSHELRQFRNIPQGDSVFGPVDYANRLLSKMYDYADEHRIWIE